MAIKIYTDAASNLFENILKEKNMDITVLPMTVQIDDKTYQCYKDKIDVAEFSKTFYELMKEGHQPKTSLPNPGLILGKMEEEVKNGNKVLFVSLASGVSGTYQTTLMLAKQVNESTNSDSIHVINSKTAGLGEGKIAMYAYEASKTEPDFDKLTAKVEEYVKHVRSEFFVDSLEYLTHTGRIKKIAAKVTSLLSIKPLLYGSDEGKIEPTSIVRGRIKALKKLADQVNDHISDKNSKIYITHCNDLEGAEKLKSTLEEMGMHDIEIYFYDLVTGSHVGPGTIAVFYDGENRKI